MKLLKAAILANFAFVAAPALAEPLTAPEYPETYAQDITETIFGEEIADPYRWLENDVRNDPEVALWVERQNAVTDQFLDQLDTREWFAERIAELTDFERFGIPRKAGENYFYTRNSGLQNQAQLYVQAGLSGERRLLIDPNAWADDGATALADWEPSPDGSLMAYSVQDGGTDWRIIRVVDVTTGEHLGDEIRWAKFTNIAWDGSEGFFYSRFPEPEEGQDFQAINLNHAVYFHKIGDPQESDRQVFSTPQHPERNHLANTSHTGRWAIISSRAGTDENFEISLIDLKKRGSKRWNASTLVPGFADSWQLVGSLDGVLYFRTDKGAPNGQIVAIDLEERRPKWRLLVAEREDPISGASIVGNRLVVEYLRDAASRAVLYDLDGRAVSAIALSGLGTASGFRGQPGDPETFYSFTSFNRPHSIYRMNLETGETAPFATPDIPFDPDKYVVEQKFYSSKDGTRVPMFIVRGKALAESGKAAPTLLFGYGGFGNSLTPSFRANRMAWLEAGGVFVIANVRGGGEYGKEWHDAGRRANKQNVFDDFIAAGEFLKAEGYTTPNGLAIQGGSNGGLLVGAVTNQRPDLFDAAHAAVGVMDMLRFDRWTAGRYWVDDFGYPDREEDFRVLKAYSPYHNIRSGTDYPAVLVTTADTDDRVVPGHSFKYAAALQAAELGDNAQLIRIETRAGHGSGKPTDKVIAEGADVLAFLAHFTGLKPSESDVQEKP